MTMVTKDYGSVEEPDEELKFSPFVKHDETSATLSAINDRLRFTGTVAQYYMTGLTIVHGAAKFNQALLIARMITGGGADLAGIGLMFPTFGWCIEVTNINADATDKLRTIDLRDGWDVVNRASDAEYTTTLGLLKMQVDVARSRDTKNNPRVRFVVTYAWDGAIVQTRIPLPISRGIMIPIVIPYVVTFGAAATIELDRVTCILSQRSPSDSGELEPLV